MEAISVSEARATLPHVLDLVARGEEVTITRHGRAVAVVVRPDSLRVRRAPEVFAAAERIHQLLEDERLKPLPEDEGLSVERAEELVREIRAGRRDR